MMLSESEMFNLLGVIPMDGFMSKGADIMEIKILRKYDIAIG